MLAYKKIQIAENERALLFKKGNFVKVLEVGVYRLSAIAKYQVYRYDLTNPVFDHPLAEFLVKRHPELLETYLQVFELGDEEVGLVYVDGKLNRLLAPATRAIYWRGLHEVRVEVQDISSDIEAPAEIASRLGHVRSLQSEKPVFESILYAEVADNQVGLLTVNKKLERLLEPGAYAFWRFNRGIEVRYLDLKLQAMEVSGQEILSKDKVSLRMNLSATYRIIDPAKVYTVLMDYADFLYREAQLGLREAVGTKTLDDLLSDKDALNAEVAAYLREKAASYGLEVTSVGVKDLILPGEMKAILNQVVEAERAAQANLIRRREETAATRSLANTARMMENNPVLLRLKELEALEKVTERIDKLTVFGGLDGVLKELVQLRE